MAARVILRSVRDGSILWTGATDHLLAVMIGSSRFSDVVLSGEGVADDHALIEGNENGAAITIRALDDEYWTWRNDKRVEREATLLPGDQIAIGDHLLELVIDENPHELEGVDTPKVETKELSPGFVVTSIEVVPEAPIASMVNDEAWSGRTYNPPMVMYNPPPLRMPLPDLPARLTMTAEEHLLFDALASDPSDDDAREVYADWLEEQNQMAKARFIRDELSLIRERGDRDTIEAQIECQYAKIAADEPWRVILSRGLIQFCELKKCPKRWHHLTTTGSLQRICGECKMTVSYCTTLDDIFRHERVVLDAGLNPHSAQEREETEASGRQIKGR